jgi:hypothetical protein
MPHPAHSRLDAPAGGPGFAPVRGRLVAVVG